MNILISGSVIAASALLIKKVLTTKVIEQNLPQVNFRGYSDDRLVEREAFSWQKIKLNPVTYGLYLAHFNNSLSEMGPMNVNELQGKSIAFENGPSEYNLS